MGRSRTSGSAAFGPSRSTSFVVVTGEILPALYSKLCRDLCLTHVDTEGAAQGRAGDVDVCAAARCGRDEQRGRAQSAPCSAVAASELREPVGGRSGVGGTAADGRHDATAPGQDPL